MPFIFTHDSAGGYSKPAHVVGCIRRSWQQLLIAALQPLQVRFPTADADWKNTGSVWKPNLPQRTNNCWFNFIGDFLVALFQTFLSMIS